MRSHAADSDSFPGKEKAQVVHIIKKKTPKCVKSVSIIEDMDMHAVGKMKNGRNKDKLLKTEVIRYRKKLR